MDYKKKYERANNVLAEIQKMLASNNLDAVDFCENVHRLLHDYSKTQTNNSNYGKETE